MRLKRLNELSPKEENDIEALLSHCNYSSPFHEISWLKIINKIFKEEILVILKYNNKANLEFFFPILLEKKGIFCDILSFSLRYELVYGGPVGRDNCFLLKNKLYRETKRILPGITKRLFLTLPPNFPIELCEREKLKHVYNTPIICLSDINNLWKSFNRGIKSNINKAKRIGLKLEIDRNEFIRDFYDYLKETYKHFGKYMLPLEYYNEIANLPYIHIFAAIYKKIPIAITIIIAHKKTIYYWSNSSSQDYRRLRPNDFLFWEISKWANERGYIYFDFLITHIKDLPGRSSFKLKFGGKLYPIYEYNYSNINNVIYKFIRHISHPKYTIQKIARKIK